MGSEEKIKRLFAKSDITVNSKINDRIINDTLTEFDKSRKTQSISPESNIWRIIMQSKLTKIAAAGVIIIAVMIVITSFVKMVPVRSCMRRFIKENAGGFVAVVPSADIRIAAAVKRIITHITESVTSINVTAVFGFCPI